MMPLDGIRVLDMTRLAPGPHCTMILGDLGAEVIKIEEPGGGRREVMERSAIAARGAPGAEEREAVFHAHNRNKKSIALNLKSPDAQRIFCKLAEKSDVIIEGFRPGVVKRLGVDYDTIKEINPRIVYCSLSGYGQDGPYRLLVGHDINYISIAGALGVIGQRGGPPAIPSNLIGDYAAGGMHAAIGILAALMARGKTGRGQYVDIAMTDGVVNLLAAHASDYFMNGVVPLRGETRLNGGVTYYNVYETKDGKYISVGCNEPWFYENLCRALGREDFISHQYATEEKREEIFRAFREIFLTKTRDEWFDILRQIDICVGPVYNLDEALSDPQILHRQMVVELEHPTFGKVKQVGISVKLSETPGQIRSLGPRRGQHTAELLTEVGYAKEDIERLRNEGAIM